MIVAREDESRNWAATGVWGRATLDQIAAKNAETRPDHPAVIDFADRPEWTGGAPETLTWRDLHTRVEALAAFFAAVGLMADSVVAIQMPPTVDAVVAFLACSRAGLIVTPLPLGTREADATETFRTLGVKAIVTVAETEGEKHGEILRGVAAEMFQIRFVFGAGGNVPDGLVDLRMVFDEAAGLGSAPEVTRKGNSADHAITVESVALAEEREGEATITRQPLPRSHNHWIATGLMILLEARLDPSSVIVSPFAMSGLVGIGAILVPWLLSGATLVTGLPRSTEALAVEAERLAATHVAVPVRFAARLVDRLAARRISPSLLLVGEDHTGDWPLSRGHELVDVTPIGVFGLVARRRTDPALVRPLPVGQVGAPAEAPMAPQLIETRIKATAQRAGQMAAKTTLGGEVQVRGAMVPHFNWPSSGQDRRHRPRDPEGWMQTGLTARLLSAQPPTFDLDGRLDDSVRVGQSLHDLDALDGVYRAVDGVADAAALLIDDPVAGPAIAAAVVPRPGTRFDPDGFVRAVEATRVGLGKIPTRVFTVPAIARGPSGRVLRTGMAQHLLARA